MCGIAGIITRDVPVDQSALERLKSALLHRGPDDQSILVEKNVGLVHTRLSIIDIAGGAQPLHMPANNTSLIANGEIYNYPDIRSDFESQGFGFSSKSDCEVILPLYKNHGESCVEYLRGMFAFCIYDRDENKLFFARDRMGEKPLYYYMNDSVFVFASELRALLASGLVPKKLNHHAIGRYYRYQYVPEPETPFEDVFKLESASTMTLDLKHWTLQSRKYWNAFDVEPIEKNPTETIRYALEDAVSSALISDVPIGLSLSGGIDSSLIASLMRKYTDRPIDAISIGYANADEFDERSQAKTLASQLGLDFHDIEIDDKEMIDRFPEMVTKRDDLIGDISGFNYFKIMEHAREQGIPVMLQGHGVDELCWGYPWVKDSVSYNEGANQVKLEEYIKAKFPWVRARKILRDISRAMSGETPFQFYELQPYTSWVLNHANSFFTPEFLRSSGILSSDTRAEYGKLNMRIDLEVTRLITDFYLRENGIAQGDRLSMASSIEMRLPFVDYKFVETVIGLRKANRDDHLPLKQLLKDSIGDLLPDEILNRPKRGFSPPTSRWQQELRETYGDLLLDGHLVENNILSGSTCRKMATVEMRDPVLSTISRLTLTLEMWLRNIL